ncbi:MAG: pilus assembly PilX N-terminal domain-containing protein [Patescibacteria group bacterium]
MKKQNHKGSSLLITLLVMAAIMGIAFGISKLSLGETKISRDISKSLIAYYAAESGIECQMYYDRLLSEAVCGNGANVYLNSAQTVYYKVEIVSGTYLNGNTGPRIIKSNGTYQDVRRAVELEY